MNPPSGNTLSKAERLCSRKRIDALFDGGARSLSAYPVRAVYRMLEPGGPAPVEVLFSVSKRRFKRAVKRNRVKRQLREAYRRNKSLLALPPAPADGPVAGTLAVAFIWMADELFASATVESRMKNLLCRLTEALAPAPGSSAP